MASAEDIRARLFMGFVDEAVNKLVGVDGEREAAIAVIALGKSREKQEEETTKEIGEIHPDVMPLSKREKHYPEITKIHRASSLGSVEELNEWRRECAASGEAGRGDSTGGGGEEVILGNPILESPPLHEVILRRGSTRRFSHRPITQQQLSTILNRAHTDIPSDFPSNNIETYLIANAVEGVENGAYYYDRSGHRLLLLKRGEFRRVAGYLCLEQELGADASVVFFLMADLEKVLEKCGNRGYRICQFEAGVRAGKIYLAAYSLGLGATGLTFYDDDITEFFRPHAGNRSNMLTVAVGVPAYKSRKGRIIIGEVKHPV